MNAKVVQFGAKYGKVIIGASAAAVAAVVAVVVVAKKAGSSEFVEVSTGEEIVVKSDEVVESDETEAQVS